MSAPTRGSSCRRKRRRTPYILCILLCGLVHLLQVSVVGCSLDTSSGTGGQSAVGGVIIRHGRSRGRHSSERRSQQQHPGESYADTTTNNGNHQTESSASKTFIEVVGSASAEQVDNETVRPEKRIIRLETVGDGGLLPYHPHPVRFSHKKAIEAKYKILKLTEKGLTNFKWNQQQQLAHRKHVSEGAPAEDVAKRRNAVAEGDVHNKEGSEDSLIGGKQLSLASGTGTEFESEQRWGEQLHTENANTANNNRPASSGRNANEQQPEEEEKGQENRSSSPRNTSKALVTHLHSYLLKTMPRKRQPQGDRLGAAQSRDGELLSSHNDRNGTVGAATAEHGERNKSISSGPDTDLSEDKSSTVDPRYALGSSRSRGRMVIGSDPNMARTWKGTDNGSDNVVTALKENNVPAADQNSSQNNAKGVGDDSVVGRVRNKSSFKSDNSNLNETKSNGTADKRNHKDGVTSEHEAAGNGGMAAPAAKRGGAADDKSRRRHQHDDTLGTKIEETVRSGGGTDDEIMTTERTRTKTLPAITTAAPTPPTLPTPTYTVTMPMEGSEGSQQGSNKSESFSDQSEWAQQEVDLKGQTTVTLAAGQVTESVPMISGSADADNPNAVDVDDAMDDGGQQKNGQTRLGGESDEKVAEQVRIAKPSHRKNATDLIAERDEANDAYSPADSLQVETQDDEAIENFLGYKTDEEEEEGLVEGANKQLESIEEDEDTSSSALDEVPSDPSRNNRVGLRSGYDKLSRFLQTVEQQHLLGANCTAGTSLNLGEGVVDRYAQERFRIQAEIAVNRANMLTR